MSRLRRKRWCHFRQRLRRGADHVPRQEDDYQLVVDSEHDRTSTRLITAHSLPQLTGRFLMGIGIGLATRSYLSEVVLPEQRGLFEAAFGMLLAASANVLLQMLDSDAVWRYQAGCLPSVFAFPVLMVVCTVPEPPKWMLQTSGSSPSSLCWLCWRKSPAFDGQVQRSVWRHIHLEEAALKSFRKTQTRLKAGMI